jgi:5-methylcytosine-specific restriction endonuclease McrA
MAHDTTENYRRLLESLKAIPLADSPRKPKQKIPKPTKARAERAHTLKLMREVVLVRDGGCCVVCGFHFTVDVHHIVPVAKGGRNHVDNLVTLCPNHHRMAHKGVINPETLFAYIADKPEGEDISDILPGYDYSAMDRSIM